jgi:hypothetical protein
VQNTQLVAVEHTAGLCLASTLIKKVVCIILMQIPGVSTSFSGKKSARDAYVTKKTTFSP